MYVFNKHVINLPVNFFVIFVKRQEDEIYEITWIERSRRRKADGVFVREIPHGTNKIFKLFESFPTSSRRFWRKKNNNVSILRYSKFSASHSLKCIFRLLKCTSCSKRLWACEIRCELCFQRTQKTCFTLRQA